MRDLLSSKTIQCGTQRSSSPEDHACRCLGFLVERPPRPRGWCTRTVPPGPGPSTRSSASAPWRGSWVLPAAQTGWWKKAETEWSSKKWNIGFVLFENISVTVFPTPLVSQDWPPRITNRQNKLVNWYSLIRIIL